MARPGQTSLLEKLALRWRAVIALLALSLAACADEAATPGRSAEAVDADMVVEAVESADGMAFEPGEVTVPAGETVTVELRNTGALRHDLVLPDGTGTDRVNAGESAVVEIGPLDESVTAWCSVPGHRNAGMELDLTVER